MSDRDTTDQSPAPATRSKRETARLIGAAVLLVLLTLFVVANTDKTQVSFLVGDVDLPLIVVLLVTAALGGAITELLRYQHNRR